MLSNTWNTEDEGQADEDGGLMIVTLFPAGIPVALLVLMNLSGVNLDSAENLKRLSFRSTRVFPLFFSLHVACTCVPSWGFRLGLLWAVFFGVLCVLCGPCWVVVVFVKLFGPNMAYPLYDALFNTLSVSEYRIFWSFYVD